MDTGTFYLYEYENNVRKRNAGFLKIYRRYQSCIFQAHIRSISLENVFEAEMYAFFFKENQICAKQIAHFPIDSMTHSIRFCAPQSSFPECRRLESIDGFFMKCSESSSLWITPNCPEKLDIPYLLKNYNEAKLGGAWRITHLLQMPEKQQPSACIGCKACMKHCPQSFEIPKYLKELSGILKELKK